MEDRCPGHRLIGGLHAGRRGRMAALEGASPGTGQADGQAQLHHLHGLPGGVGEVCRPVANRNAHRTPHPGADHPRPQAGDCDV